MLSQIKVILLTSFFICAFSASAKADIDKDLTGEEQIIDVATQDQSEIQPPPSQSNLSNADPKASIAIFKFNKEETYKINLRTGIATIINLPDNEKITFFTLGNSKAFTATHNKQLANILNIKTLQSGVDSNLIIKTDEGSIYNFYLRAIDEKSEILPHFTVYISKNDDEEQLSEQKELLKKLQENNDYIKKIASLDQLNTAYKIKGTKEIAPLYVYDDSKWTYFDFGKNFVSDRLPTVYKVVDGFDSVINTRMEGSVLVAQSLSVEGWILKNGDKYVCITPKKSLFKIYKDERFKK